MNLAFYIARRYLVAKKSHNAINLISMISVCSVAIATIALVCVMSVMNGFFDLVSSMFSNFDPELKITPVKGKVFDPNTHSFQLIREMPEIELYSEVLEENVLVRYRERQEFAVAKGVSDNFQQMVHIDSVLINGEFVLRDGDVYGAIMGIGLSSMLGIRTGFVDPIEIYVPIRDRQVNMANVTSSFQLEYAFLKGEFMVNQAVYDENYMILPIEMMRELLKYETEITALELKLNLSADLKTVQKQIQSILGEEFRVQDRFEQQESTFKMIQLEKWISFLVLAFILTIALFSVVSSLSMLMIEKQEDVWMLRSMGADDRLIRSIFLYEGSMIPASGAMIGILIGVILCLAQQEFGIIKMGSAAGAFISDNYPVRVHPVDLLMIFATVCVIGLLAAWYPVRYLGNKWLNKSRFAAILLPFLLCMCQNPQSGKPSVAVTIEPQRYFANMIAGDHFDVFAVVPVGQSPESYDPAPHEMMRIARSVAYLQIGRIGFEQAWMPAIRSNNPHLKFYDLSEGVEWIGEEENEEFNVVGASRSRPLDSKFEEEESDHHHHDGTDPHIWSATIPAKIIAHNTLQAFMDLDPERKSLYMANYQRLIEEIEDTSHQLHAMLDTLTNRTFIIYHPALTYFANEFGLNQLSIEADGKEPSVASMKALIDEARKAHVRVVFVQQEFDRKHAEQIATAINARVAIINPLDRDWKNQMIHVAQELTK